MERGKGRIDVKKEVSEAINAMKAMAIMSVAAAHCVYSNDALQRVTDIIGVIGVIVFLIISGVLFNKEEAIKVFLGKKFKRLIIPWLLYGLLTYAINLVIAKKSFRIEMLFKWIIGYKTWLYYVPILLICMIIVKVIKKDMIIWVLILATIVSIWLTSEGYLSFLSITPYQNPLNWIGFFCLGVLLQKTSIKRKVPVVYGKKYYFVFGCISGVLVLAFILYYGYTKHYEIKPSYWLLFSVVFELMASLFIYLCSFLLAKIKLIRNIGEISFPIYFLHMQVGINVVEIIFAYIPLMKIIGGFIVIVQPILVVIVTYILIKAMQLIARKIKIDKKIWIIGL